MGVITLRWILSAVLLAAFTEPPTRAQSSGAQKFQIRVTDPAFTGLPVWIYAELSFPLEIRYPYGEDPEDFGPNRLEVKRENQLLEKVPFKPWVGRGGIVDGWIAPPSSPKNRLPLHLQYSLDRPGMYSVRWTMLRHNFQNGQMIETVVAQSDWLDFQVLQSTPDQRKDWFEEDEKAMRADESRSRVKGFVFIFLTLLLFTLSHVLAELNFF